jgi:hypothetical protein
MCEVREEVIYKMDGEGGGYSRISSTLTFIIQYQTHYP